MNKNIKLFNNNHLIENQKFSGKKMIKEIKDILSRTSMKEKYEELLNRELILPPKYKTLLKKFENLDFVILELKKLKKTTSYPNIRCLLKERGIDFNLDDFKRILFVVPHFFIYKWEKSQSNSINKKNLLINQMELIIDIPNDISKRVKVKNKLFIFY